VTQFTVQPTDRPSDALCSRCGGQLSGRAVVAEWNGLKFSYCRTCQPKMPEVAKDGQFERVGECFKEPI
jgi:hypothetical protein